MENESGRAPRRSRWVRPAGIGALILIVGGLGFQARRFMEPPRAEASSEPTKPAKGKNGKEKEPALVAVRPVEVGPISSYTTATANLVAEDEVKILAEAEGKVVKLLVEEGDRVARGGMLVQIDPTEATLAVGKSDLALRNAQITLDRSERMAGEKLISPQDLDRVRYERDRAAQELAEARHRLSRTSVTAPFSGRVTVRKVQLGQNVKVGDELLTFSDFEPLVARIFLPEREVMGLRLGQEVRLTLRAHEGTRFAGRIRQISPVVDTSSGTVKVTVEALAPPPAVRPGAFVSVEVLRETRPRALLVPRSAVIRELQEAHVFVAEGTTARRRIVELGLEEGDRVEVVRGLKAGDTVVTAGQGALKDQSPIALASPSPQG